MRSKLGSQIISLRVSEREAKWIDHYAMKEKRSRASWLRKLVTDHLISLSAQEKGGSQS